MGEILEGWSLAREQKRKGWLLGPHWCMKIIGVSRAHNFWLERREKKQVLVVLYLCLFERNYNGEMKQS